MLLLAAAAGGASASATLASAETLSAPAPPPGFPAAPPGFQLFPGHCMSELPACPNNRCGAKCDQPCDCASPAYIRTRGAVRCAPYPAACVTQAETACKADKLCTAFAVSTYEPPPGPRLPQGGSYQTFAGLRNDSAVPNMYWTSYAKICDGPPASCRPVAPPAPGPAPGPPPPPPPGPPAPPPPPPPPTYVGCYKDQGQPRDLPTDAGDLKSTDSPVRKTAGFFSDLYIKMMILPRQARDKHRDPPLPPKALFLSTFI